MKLKSIKCKYSKYKKKREWLTSSIYKGIYKINFALFKFK